MQLFAVKKELFRCIDTWLKDLVVTKYIESIIQGISKISISLSSTKNNTTRSKMLFYCVNWNKVHILSHCVIFSFLHGRRNDSLKKQPLKNGSDVIIILTYEILENKPCPGYSLQWTLWVMYFTVPVKHSCVYNKDILLDVLLCSIAEYLTSCAVLWRARRVSQNTNDTSDTTQQNV